jgi:hypothetical protein
MTESPTMRSSTVASVKILFLLLTCCAFAWDAAHAGGAPAPVSRAELQDAQADVVLFFDWFDTLYFEKPWKHRDPFPLPALAGRIAAITQRRDLIVVIMSPSTQTLPDKKFKKTVDDLETRLHQIGFKKVIFHLCSAFSPPPIYRE